MCAEKAVKNREGDIEKNITWSTGKTLLDKR